jgi:pimeloyl-ACP methyl ester carboxylesterase
MNKTLKIPGPKGLNIAAVYHQPSAAGPHPLVILLHGFTGWKEEEHIATLADDLAEAGIAALRFDAPGSGESEGTWAQDYRFANYLAAVLDVRAYATAELGADPKRIAIWGHSMGGLTALITAARHPDLFVALCANELSSGKHGYADIDEWKATNSRHFSNSHFPDIELPYEFYEDRLKGNQARVPSAEALKMPSLFIGGTNDKLVPADSVRDLFTHAPRPKQYAEFEMGHGYKQYPDTLAQVNGVTVDFFKRILLPN